MGEIRRRELIAATVAIIHDDGFSDATVARIARRAGVSTGIVHHYFRNKNDLMEATMRSLGDDLAVEIRGRLKRARTPLARLHAVIDGNFAPHLYRRPVVIAWLAFWAQVPFSEQLDRIQGVIYGRLRSNLAHALRRLLPAEAVAPAVLELITVIDGLWLRCALTEGGLPAKTARDMAHRFLDRLLLEQTPTEETRQ